MKERGSKGEETKVRGREEQRIEKGCKAKGKERKGT